MRNSKKLKKIMKENFPNLAKEINKPRKQSLKQDGPKEDHT